MTGSLCPELSGTSYIRASTGYTAKIEYLCKGWISGKRNYFVATLFHDDHEKEPLYSVEGQWNGEFTITKIATKEVERIDTSALKRAALEVRPVTEQHPLESRRAWRHVASAIHKNDYFAVGYEKSKIENEQRELRKKEKANGVEFQGRYFSEGETDEVAEQLVNGIKSKGICKKGLRVEMDGGHGFWRWDEGKFEAVEERRRNGVKSPTRTRFQSLDSGIGGMTLEDEEK